MEIVSIEAGVFDEMNHAFISLKQRVQQLCCLQQDKHLSECKMCALSLMYHHEPYNHYAIVEK